MPRGDNPNSRANLTAKSSEEARELGRKGGKASGIARREYKSLTEALRAQVGSKEMEELTIMLYKRAKQGNLKAYELLRDQLGEKPIERINVATVDENTIKELEDAVKARNNTDAE